MAQTLVDLQSGGTQTYAAVKADVDAHGSDADSIFAVDDFLNETLVPSIELKQPERRRAACAKLGCA